MDRGVFYTLIAFHGICCGLLALYLLGGLGMLGYLAGEGYLAGMAGLFLASLAYILFMKVGRSGR